MRIQAGVAISHSNQHQPHQQAPAITRADKREDKQLPSQQINPKEVGINNVSCRDPVPLLPVQEPRLQGGQHHMPPAASAPKEPHPRPTGTLRAHRWTRNRLVPRMGPRTTESRSVSCCDKMPKARRGGCLGDR
ncbi:hypothetical protein CCMA1212_003880 [Trichoderma ghanense]|uniref:Uncharacterized protein n=1 Tax=Trichoderma ghanense TaxID=65468 RepID=A0ABY2H9V1_9HYPO